MALGSSVVAAGCAVLEAAGPDLVSALLSAERRHYSKLSRRTTLEGADWFTLKKLWDKPMASGN